MKRIWLAVLAAILMTTETMAASDGKLDASKRVLLVFSDTSDPALAEQSKLLDAAGQSAFEERDLLVLLVPAAGKTRVLVGGPADAYEAAALRRSRNVAPDAGFTVLLVGKDGGTKWQAKRPASPEAVFSIIDAMPMRLNEMRRNRP